MAPTRDEARRDGSIRVKAWRDRARTSLFLVPASYLAAAVVLGGISIWADRTLATLARELPWALASTTESARAVLTTVATATVTVAGISFSVALLVFQLASTRFSPRVIQGLFRDPFNKHVMGVVVGTFGYCLVVLRSVHTPLSGADREVPTISTAVAVVLGITSLLTIVAFINHSAHMMEVSDILQRITDTAVDQARHPPRRQPDHQRDEDPAAPPPEPGFVVACDRHGWLQQIDQRGVLAALAPGGVARLDTAVGRYAIEGSSLCTVWPVPETAGERDEIVRRVRASVRTGRTRTMGQDPAYAVRQLVDVALIALSPGVNDPTTAQDAIFHLASALRYLLLAPSPRSRRDDRGARLLLPEALTHDELIVLAFDELRRDAARRPTVCIYLLESLHLLSEALDRASEGEAPTGVHDALRRQARLVLEGCERSGALAEDLEGVRDAYTRRFAPPPDSG